MSWLSMIRRRSPPCKHVVALGILSILVGVGHSGAGPPDGLHTATTPNPGTTPNSGGAADGRGLPQLVHTDALRGYLSYIALRKPPQNTTKTGILATVTATASLATRCIERREDAHFGHRESSAPSQKHEDFTKVPKVSTVKRGNLRTRPLRVRRRRWVGQ